MVCVVMNGSEECSLCFDHQLEWDPIGMGEMHRHIQNSTFNHN